MGTLPDTSLSTDTDGAAHAAGFDVRGPSGSLSIRKSLLQKSAKLSIDKYQLNQQLVV